MYKCTNCNTTMTAKGEIAQDTICYQCPKCKNIELHTTEYSGDLRLTYP